MSKELTFLGEYIHGTKLSGRIMLGKERIGFFVCNIKYLIPQGQYSFVFYKSKKFKRECIMLDVVGRSGIAIHPADYASQLRGCFATANFDISKAEKGITIAKLFQQANSNLHLTDLISTCKSNGINSLNFQLNDFCRVFLTGHKM